MNNTQNNQGWSPQELVEENKQRTGLIGWWYANTALPTPPSSASFVEREAARKSQLTATIIFWLLVCFILFIPGCLTLPNPFVIWADAIMIVFSFIAIFFNRSRWPQGAGLLLTLGFEIALTLVIFTTWPLDEPSIQQYELFVFGELLCVSLLSSSSVFIVMLYNIGIILASLFLQPHTAVLNHDLQMQLIPIIIRPVGVQFLVAFVSWLWVNSASKALKRADRAEMIAYLEHQLVDEREHLQQGINQILQTHVEVANGNLKARAPLNQDNVLWQIARSLNMLLDRLQRSVIQEQRLKRMEMAVQAQVQAIQQAEQQNEKPVLNFTQTELDMLIAALQGKELGRTTQLPSMQRSPQTFKSQ
ncbi:hypothetical protein [Dictyobacter aurantiacus]|uniref:HAMP domain-containing protein n=1 Tax=Dictyobacter aurantiacus TaxID=1936993 RepID=A0A401ZRK1_9CHLR|nr:hypothetical protein [Dictyobacter aurantiacus]GCE09410.1 hypothetical protein KDAU_67390 [Dictyobacter aurantiacus]